jgi:hypothetical protein
MDRMTEARSKETRAKDGRSYSHADANMNHVSMDFQQTSGTVDSKMEYSILFQIALIGG